MDQSITLKIQVGTIFFTLRPHSEVRRETTALSKRNTSMQIKKHPPVEQLPLANWLTSNDGKDVYAAACLEIVIGQETNQHCPFLFFGAGGLWNKIEMYQTNTVNN